MKFLNKILRGDALKVLRKLPDESVDCVITSPPYWALRDYGVKGQLGLERTMNEYVTKLCNIFDEVKRTLKKTGTCWINIGDTYYGGGRNRNNTTNHIYKQHTSPASFIKQKWTGELYNKCLCQIPARFAIEMISRGWILRNEIIWYKPNVMPSSVKDRFTVDYEKIFFFTKSKKYYFTTQYEPAKYDGRKQEMMRGSGKYLNKIIVPGHDKHSFAERAHERWQMINGRRVRNKRAVWGINNKPYRGAHFATFPPGLCKTPILAGCPQSGTVMDIFAGSGTALMIAKQLGRNFVGIELNPEYIKLANQRINSILI